MIKGGRFTFEMSSSTESNWLEHKAQFQRRSFCQNTLAVPALAQKNLTLETGKSKALYHEQQKDIDKVLVLCVSSVWESISICFQTFGFV